MHKLNILNKEGMLTNEDRLQPLSHTCDYFTFTSCLDLSIGVIVTPLGSYKSYPVDVYSKDLASFISWWTYFIMCDLNGFSGFSHVKFTIVECQLI